MNLQPVQPSHSKGVPPLSSNSLHQQPRRGPRHRPVDHGGALPAGPHPGGHRPHRGHPGPGLGRGRAGLLLCPRGAGSRALPPGLSRPRPAEAAGPLPLCRGDEPLPAQQPADEVPPGPHGRSRQAGLERRPPRDPGAAAEDRGRPPSPGRDPGRRGGGLAHSRPAARSLRVRAASLPLRGRTAAGSRDGTGAALRPAPPPQGRANRLSAGPDGLPDGLHRHQPGQRELRGPRSPGGAAGHGLGGGPLPGGRPRPPPPGSLRPFQPGPGRGPPLSDHPALGHLQPGGHRLAGGKRHPQEPQGGGPQGPASPRDTSGLAGTPAAGLVRPVLAFAPGPQLFRPRPRALLLRPRRPQGLRAGPAKGDPWTS